MAEVQARTGLKSHQGHDLTTEECLLLSQKLTSREMPSYCAQLLHNANKTGILSRRASRVGKAWDLSDGHGKRTMYYENDVPGGAVDSVKGPSYSVPESYMASKSPAAQEKIRRLRTRMSVKGAINLQDVDPVVVEGERKKEMKRRMSRRAEMKAKH